MNAWITPGSHPMSVRMMLISKVEPTPWFIYTARGGNRIFKIIVSILLVFLVIL